METIRNTYRNRTNNATIQSAYDMQTTWLLRPSPPQKKKHDINKDMDWFPNCWMDATPKGRFLTFEWFKIAQNAHLWCPRILECSSHSKTNHTQSIAHGPSFMLPLSYSCEAISHSSSIFLSKNLEIQPKQKTQEKNTCTFQVGYGQWPCIDILSFIYLQNGEFPKQTLNLPEAKS